jgi:hypothetical protein
MQLSFSEVYPVDKLWLSQPDSLHAFQQAYVLSVCNFLSTQYVKELLPDKWDCSTDSSSAGISRLLLAMQFEYVRREQ